MIRSSTGVSQVLRNTTSILSSRFSCWIVFLCQRTTNENHVLNWFRFKFSPFYTLIAGEKFHAVGGVVSGVLCRNPSLDTRILNAYFYGLYHRVLGDFNAPTQYTHRTIFTRQFFSTLHRCFSSLNYENIFFTHTISLQQSIRTIITVLYVTTS